MSTTNPDLSLAEQGYRFVERLGRKYIVLASPKEKNYMLFVETDVISDVAVWIKGQGYEFVRPITEANTPDFYAMACDAEV